ncbi:MAG: putative toxin-antitoxin system toxin component, PIN family [Solirubrobacteraceae bacterium]
MRVVIDSSVFVSALIGKEGAAPDLVLGALADEQIEVVASPLLIAELEGVLARPKFAHISLPQRTEYVGRIRDQSEIVADPETGPSVVRDQKDDYIVALARAARVDAIVSTDRDLLDAGLEEPRF